MGLSHFGEPPSLLRLQPGTPHQLGFRPKKVRKETAGRPCPTPRTQGWGDKEVTLALKHKTVLVQFMGGRGAGTREPQSPLADIGTYSRQPPSAGLWHLTISLPPKASRTVGGGTGWA